MPYKKNGRHHRGDGRNTMFKPESAIILPFLFRAAVSRLAFSFIEDVAGYIGKKPDTRQRQQCGRRMKS
jgi:hypothetical protein